MGFPGDAGSAVCVRVLAALPCTVDWPAENVMALLPLRENGILEVLAGAAEAPADRSAPDDTVAAPEAGFEKINGEDLGNRGTDCEAPDAGK